MTVGTHMKLVAGGRHIDVRHNGVGQCRLCINRHCDWRGLARRDSLHANVHLRPQESAAREGCNRNDCGERAERHGVYQHVRCHRVTAGQDQHYCGVFLETTRHQPKH